MTSVTNASGHTGAVKRAWLHLLACGEWMTASAIDASVGHAFAEVHAQCNRLVAQGQMMKRVNPAFTGRITDARYQYAVTLKCSVPRNVTIDEIQQALL